MAREKKGGFTLLNEKLQQVSYSFDDNCMRRPKNFLYSKKKFTKDIQLETYCILNHIIFLWIDCDMFEKYEYLFFVNF